MSSAKSFGVCVCVLFINQKVMFRKKKEALIQFTLTGGMGVDPIPAVIGQEVGYSLEGCKSITGLTQR